MHEEFQLTDRKGVTHTYAVTAHPTAQGVGLTAEILGLGAPSLITAIGAALESEELRRAVAMAMVPRASKDEAALEEEVQGIAEILDMVRGMDLRSLGQEIGLALQSGRIPDLATRIVCHTLRDGIPLSNPAAFESAYRANYWELGAALKRISEINGFFQVPGTSPGTPAKVQIPSEPPPATAPEPPPVTASPLASSIVPPVSMGSPSPRR